MAEIRALLARGGAGDISRDVALKQVETLGGAGAQLIPRAFSDWIVEMCNDIPATGFPSAGIEEVANAAITRFSLNPSDIPSRRWEQFVMYCAGRDLDEGRVPDRVKVQGNLPFLLESGERIVWVFQPAQYLEDRVVRSSSRGYAGLSVRVAPGVYLHGGESDRPEASAGFVSVDNGMLAASDRAILFKGNHEALRLRYKDLIAIERFDYGLSVCKGTASARNQGFEVPSAALPGFPFMLVQGLAKIYMNRH